MVLCSRALLLKFILFAVGEGPVNEPLLCPDETFIPTDGSCVKCFGIGAEVVNGECTCTLEHSVFSPVNFGECICMSEDEGVFTFEPEDGDAKCVLCYEVGNVFNAETGECDNPAAQFEDLEIAEIRLELDIFQACVFDFFVATTAGFEANEAGQKALMIGILFHDFRSVEIGGLKKFLLDEEDNIFGGTDIDLALAVTADNFFSIDTVFNMLSVFLADGTDLAQTEIMDAVKSVTTATFFKLTAVTFDFDLFVDVFIAVDVTLEVVIAKIEVALGFSICLGPGISVGGDGECICDINLAIFNAETFSCECNAESGLKFDNEDAPTRCVCEDDLFAIVDDVCEVKPVEEIIAELDAFQMCVGAFFVESLELDETCATTVNYALAGVDFADFAIGTLGTFLTDADLGADFAGCVVDLAVIIEEETFFSIEVLVGIIAVFVEAEIDITASTFIADIDELITVDFWVTTAATFSLEIFAEFVVEFDVTIEAIAEGLAEADDFVPCFGPSAVVKKGVCECEIDFMEYNADMGKSSKIGQITVQKLIREI